MDGARALADSARHDQALVVVREALRRAPDDTDLLWLEAGIEGWAGRHANAVALYTRLGERHPELLPDLRSDLAAERLWSGDASGAVRDFDLRLAEAPDDLEAARMRALALAYADRHKESLAAYDTLLVARRLGSISSSSAPPCWPGWAVTTTRGTRTG